MSSATKEARNYLDQAYRLDQRIRIKLEQLAQLKTMVTSITSNLSDVRIQSSSDNSKMENTIIKIIEQETELDNEIDTLVDLKAEIRRVIEAVPEKEQRFLLEERYLVFRKWEQIAADMQYGIDNVFKLHQKALSNVKIPDHMPKSYSKLQ